MDQRNGNGPLGRKINHLPRSLSGLIVLSALAVAGCGGNTTTVIESTTQLERVEIVPLNSFGRVIPDAPVIVDNLVEGYGPMTLLLDLAKVHMISGGKTRKYPRGGDSVIFDGTTTDRKFEIKYNATHLAEVCITPKRRGKDGKPEVFTITAMLIGGEAVHNQEEDGSYCNAVGTERDLTASSIANVNLLAGELGIAAEALEAGKSRTYEILHVEPRGATYQCALTTPVRGEVFVVGKNNNERRSIGWQVGGNLACAWLNENDIGFAFGPVDNDTAATVEFESLGRLPNQNANETAVGWYQRRTTDLHCITAKGPWGPGSVNPSFLRVDRNDLTRPYDREVCTALTPQFRHTLTCGPSQYRELVPKDRELVIPANNMQPGQLFRHTCEYVQPDQPPGPNPTEPENKHRAVVVAIENDFSMPQSARYVVNGFDLGNRGTEAYWDNGKNPGSEDVRIRFLPEAYLKAPSDFAMTQQQLAALKTTDPNYDATKRAWRFKVTYMRAQASWLACAETGSNDGTRYTNPYAWFNGLEPANQNVEKRGNVYRVVPTGIQVTIGYGWHREGLRSARPINVRVRRWNDGDRPTCYLGEYIPENSVAEIRVGTNGQQGDIVLNGRSIGNSGSSNGQIDVYVNVDVFRANEIAFETVRGVTPLVLINGASMAAGHFVFSSNDRLNPDPPGSLRWQSSTSVVADYRPTRP